MLESLFNLFITEQTRHDINTVAKAKNIVLLASSLATINAFFALYSLVAGLPLMIVSTCLTATIAYLIPLVVLRKTQSPVIAGTIITIEAFCVITALCFMTSDTLSQVMAWFVGVPVIAAMTSGRRFSMIAGAVSLLTMLIFEQMRNAFSSINGISEFLVVFFLVFFVTLCLAALEQAKATMLSHLQHERTRASDEATKAEALAEALAEEKRHIEEKITLAIAASEMQKVRLAEGVHTMLEAMNALAHGDLTKRIELTGQDEVTQLYEGFNDVAGKFEQMVAEVQDAIQNSATTTTEVNYAATQIAAAVEEQSAQMTHIAAAVEQMFQSVRNNMLCVQETSQASTENHTNAQGGGMLMTQMMTKMQEIVTMTQQSEQLVEHLHQRSEEIGEIVSVIHEIADQTNLLALNAAIEAARAGEHGRGFSVVADEVRKLAERTVSATKQITQTVKDIQQQTGNVMSGIRSSTREVESGITIAQDAGSSFALIVSGDEHIRLKVQEIASATEQQSHSNQQINASIQQIAAATQETSAIVQEVSTSTDHLSKRMQRLLQLAAAFQTSSMNNAPALSRSSAITEQRLSPKRHSSSSILERYAQHEHYAEQPSVHNVLSPRFSHRTVVGK